MKHSGDDLGDDFVVDDIVASEGSLSFSGETRSGGENDGDRNSDSHPTTNAIIKKKRKRREREKDQKAKVRVPFVSDSYLIKCHY